MFKLPHTVMRSALRDVPAAEAWAAVTDSVALGEWLGLEVELVEEAERNCCRRWGGDSGLLFASDWTPRLAAPSRVAGCLAVA
ncbi:MAG: hypothetical protein R2725_01825 [Solirubrobacterales bacterium]